MEHTTCSLDAPGARADNKHKRPRSPGERPPAVERTASLDTVEEEGDEEQLGPSSAVPGTEAGPVGSSVSSAQQADPAACQRGLLAALHAHPCPVLGHVLLSSYAQAWARRCGIGPQRLEAARAGLAAAGALACTPLPQAPGLPPGLELWHTRGDGIAALQAASTEEKLAVQACISGQSLAVQDVDLLPQAADAAGGDEEHNAAARAAGFGADDGGQPALSDGGGAGAAVAPASERCAVDEGGPGGGNENDERGGGGGPPPSARAPSAETRWRGM